MKRQISLVIISLIVVFVMSYTLTHFLFNRSLKTNISYAIKSQSNLMNYEFLNGIEFININSNILTLGYLEDDVIVKISSIPKTDSEDLRLNIEYMHLDKIDIVYKDMTGHSHYLMGGKNRENFSNKNKFSFELKNLDINQDIYIKIATTSSCIIPILLYDSGDYAEHTAFLYGVDIFFLLTLILMLVFNVMFYFSFRERSFAIFSFYVLGFLFYIFSGSKLSLNQLGLVDLSTNILIIKISILTIGICSLIFAMDFFEIKYGSALFNYLAGVISIWGTLIIVIPLLEYDTFMLAITYLSIMTAVILLSLSVRKIFEGFKPASIYLSSWIVLILALIYHSIYILGVDESSYFIIYILKVSFCIQALLVTSSVTYKIFFIAEENQTILKQFDKFKNDLLANTSHDLKTPLLGIIGLLEFSIENYSEGISSSFKENLLKVVACSKRLNLLVDDIMDYSRATNGKLKLYKKEVNAYNLIEYVIDILKHSGFQNSNRIVNNLNPSDTYIYCDENRILQVFFNLIGNSLKFTMNGYIYISRKESNIYDEFVIEDTGIGISENNIDFIFNEYMQVDKKGEYDSRNYGIGLGLSIVKNIVLAHSGIINVSSIEGNGTKISFSIPKFDSRVSPTSVNEKNTLIEVGNKSENINKILLVDDDDVNLTVLSNTLLSNGYLIKTTKDTEKVIPLLINENFDLIIIDVMMPEVSGYYLCREIRQIFENTLLPIALITSGTTNLDMTLAYSSGANDYFSRSISKVELKQRIKNLLDIKRAYKKIDRINEKLNQAISLSKIDSLTGIYNRRHFFEEYKRLELSLSNSFSPLSLLMIDVDYFKSINDNYGHSFGDTILIKIAEILHFSIREKDLICRFGGEEFLILLNKTDIDSAVIIAERIRKSISAQKFSLNKTENIHVTISIGISSTNGVTKSIEDLIEAADRNLYKAKSNGRNCISFISGIPA